MANSYISGPFVLVMVECCILLPVKEMDIGALEDSGDE